MIAQILFILVVFAAVGIIVLVLLQQGKSDAGSAFGGGGSQSVFGSRGSANFLSRSTSVLVSIFFLGSLALAFVYTKERGVDRSVTEQSVIQEDSGQPSDVPAVPELTDKAALDAAEGSSAVIEGADVPAVPNPAISEPASPQVEGELPATPEVPK